MRQKIDPSLPISTTSLLVAIASTSVKLISALVLTLAVAICVARTVSPLVQQQPKPPRVLFPGPVASPSSLGQAAAAIAISKPPTERPQVQQHFQLGGKCALKSSCSRQASSRRLESDASADKLSCHCDQLCRLYDDCCHDSRWAEPVGERARLGGRRLRQRRHSDWHCKRINPIFGSVLLKAKCHPDWPQSEHWIRRRCELSALDISSNSSDHHQLQSDPMGSLMPITDAASGITYANSYCLRCNSARSGASSNAKQKLTYWSPLVTCSYNLDSDDRNTLFDLISAYQGQVLKYSPRRNKWLIANASESGAGGGAHNATKPASPLRTNGERECQIVPTIPDSIEHMIRFCHPDVVDSCPSQVHQGAATANATDSGEQQRARFECQHGHQALTYSQTSASIYYNPACAKCHNERQVFCEPKMRKGLSSDGVQFNMPKSNIVVQPVDSAGRQQAAPTIEGAQEPPASIGLGGEAARSGGAMTSVDQQSSTGSFSVLMDLYGAFQGDGASGGNVGGGAALVGAVHRCEDADRQVYDPFLLTCRDIVCGLNHRFVDGSCVEEPQRPAVGSNEGKQILDSLVQLSANGSNGTLASNLSGNLSSTFNESAIVTTLATSQVATATEPARSADTAQASKQVDIAEKPPTTSTLAADHQHLLLPIVANGATAAPKGVDSNSSSALAASELSATSLSPSSSASSSSPTSEGALDSGAAIGEEPKQQVVQLPGAQQQQQQALFKEKLVDNKGSEAAADRKVAAAAFARPIGPMSESLEKYLSLLPRPPDDLPQPDAKSRRQFAECGKILIEPKHYQLLTMEELRAIWNKSNGGDGKNGSESNSAGTAAGRQASQSASDLVLALVLPYKLILGPSEFELVRSNADTSKEAFNLLVCSPFKSDLVNKFHPAMAYLTTCCLIISITSLVCYLLLYLISTIDLRSLLVEMAQAANRDGAEVDLGCKWCWFWSSSPLDSKFRGSRASNEAATQSARSQSLSSRGVACLSGALLAAYLLFILGHKRQQSHDAAPDEPGDSTNSCAAIATGTYFFFLLAFNWMFLLSYDIWRTLRLATCCLRGPATHSQSRRFLTYAICAFSFAAVVTLIVFTLDHIDLDSAKGSPLSDKSASSSLQLDLERFVLNYRPKFGQRSGSCWFSNKRSLALFFGLPVTLIMVINLVFFLHSSFMVIQTSSRSSRRPVSQTSSNASTSSPELARAKDLQAKFAHSGNDSTNSMPASTTTTDFTQQNSLTTSSFASVQTIQSNLDSNSLVVSRRNSTDSTSTSSSFHRQDSSDSAASSGYNSSSGDTKPSMHTGEGNQAIRIEFEDIKAAAMSGKQLAGDSSLHPTSKFLATKANIINKCDVQLNQLSALISTLVKDYRLYCRLSTIMGLTWLTGVIASMVDQSDILWYLFVLLNTLQGLFIFIAFGLKRSKLTNLSILLSYLSFKGRQLLAEKDDKQELPQEASQAKEESSIEGKHKNANT